MQITHHHTLCLHTCSSICHCGWTQGVFDSAKQVSTRFLLASGSRYRAELLRRLNQPFLSFSPDIDESALPDEAPADLASRLARQKAHAVASHSAILSATEIADNTIIIASDQVACAESQVLGKPGSLDNARLQLRTMSGQSVHFHTALYMMSRESDEVFAAMDTTTAVFRELSDDEIFRYVSGDVPLDCAGSFKAESLGISLFSAIHSNDPTALVGLPMIAVCQGLRQLGLDVP